MAKSISPLRWHMKKVARQIMSRGSSTLRLVGNCAPAIRVLTYHRFGETFRDPFCVAAEDLEAQVSFIAERQMALSLDEFIGYLASPSTLDSDKVLLTIDDGFMSTASIALPILEHYAVPSVAFISPGLVGTGIGDDNLPEPYMDWNEIEQLNGSSMRIGSHSMHHRSYGRLTLEQVHLDAMESKRQLENHLDYRVTSIAYPYGTMSDYNSDVARVVADCGYDTAFTSYHGAVHPDSPAYEIPRVKIESGEDLAFFERLTRGAMDSWSIVDKHLSRVQANG